MAKMWLDLLSEEHTVLNRVCSPSPLNGRRRKPLLGDVLNLSDLKKLSLDIESFKPDVVIFGNLNSITPAALHVTRKHGVKCVCIFHNWRAVCANGLLFRDGHLCYECPSAGVSAAAVVHRCAWSDSLATAVGIDWHKLARTWEIADAILVPSVFMIDALKRFGLGNCKLRCFPNWAADLISCQSSPREGALFAGALNVNKGLLPLLDSWTKTYARHGQRLHVMGQGGLQTQVEEFARSSEAIVFEGRKERREVLERMSQVKVTIAPSVSLETFGLVAIESMSLGTPLITGALGGLADINSESTGVQIDSMNPDSLLLAFQKIENNWTRYSQCALERFETYYSVASARQNLIDLLEWLR